MLFRELNQFIPLCSLPLYTMALMKQSFIEELFYFRSCGLLLHKTLSYYGEFMHLPRCVWGRMCSWCMGTWVNMADKNPCYSGIFILISMFIT